MHESLVPLGTIYYNASGRFGCGYLEGWAKTLRADTHPTAVVLQIPLGVLRNVRSEYGKAIRKDYENGNLQISRHKFLEKEIREDGMVNTLDSVQKDNWLAAEVREATKKGYSVARGGETQSTSRYQAAEREEDESG